MKCSIQTVFTALLMLTSVLYSSTWEPPMDISNNLPGNGDGVIVVDSQGNAATIWQDPATNTVLTSYRLFEGLWENPIALGTADPNPYICVDEAGNLRAVWEFGATIRTATRPLGGTWTPYVQIYTKKANFDNLRVACVENNGYSVVSWTEIDVTNTVKAATWNGSSWTITPLNVTTNQTVSLTAKPIPRILPSGTTFVAFLANSVKSGNDDIYTTMGSAATGTWATIAPRNFVKPTSFDFALSSTGNGGIACLDGTNQINATYYIGGVWGGVGNVTTTASDAALIGFDRFNMATIVYPTSLGEIRKASTNAAAISYQDAGISPGTTGYHTPKLSVSENGGMVASYLGPSGGIYGQTGKSGVFEASPASLNALAKNESVAMSDNGTAYALWKDTVTTGFMEASRTYNPADNLLKVLGKKRLMYQKGLLP